MLCSIKTTALLNITLIRVIKLLFRLNYGSDDYMLLEFIAKTKVYADSVYHVHRGVLRKIFYKLHRFLPKYLERTSTLSL